MRQIVLDTETTGLEPEVGHRVIEIGAVELLNRRLTNRHFHVYLNPERDIDAAAVEVHGIRREFLQDKPRFAEVAAQFLEFIDGGELIIHNAAFDLGFLNYELSRLEPALGPVDRHCPGVIDSLLMARQKHPGQKNNLDALCRRYDVDDSRRELHGALLDAELLANVYLAMTGGQTSLLLGDTAADADVGVMSAMRRLPSDRPRVRVVHAGDEELTAHDAIVAKLGSGTLWPLRADPRQ